MMKSPAGRLFVLQVAAVLCVGCQGQHEEPGEIVGAAIPGSVLAARAERQTQAVSRLAEGVAPEARPAGLVAMDAGVVQWGAA